MSIRNTNNPPTLSPKKMIALRTFLRTSSYTQAGMAAGVSRQSVRQWSRSKEWQAALADATRSIVPTVKIKPRRLFEQSLLVLENDLVNGSAEAKSEAAKLIFSKLAHGMLAQQQEEKLAEFGRRIATLQKMLEEKSGKKITKAKSDIDNFGFDEE